MATLDSLGIGGSATVTKVGGVGELRRRLLDMGLTRGARVTLLRVAPMGDPMEFRVRGYHLSLRKTEAQLIEVEIANS